MSDQHEGLHLKLFGVPAVTCGGKPVRLALKRAYALLAVLALEARPVPRGYLGSLLWPDADLATTRTRLRRLVYRMNDACGRDLLTSYDGALSLAADTCSCDAVGFRHAARELVGKGVCNQAFAALVQLTRLACDPLLEGVSFGSAMFEDWLHVQQLEHQHLLARMLVRTAEIQGERGEFEDAVDTLERLLRLDPFCEPAHVQRMSIAAAMGDTTGVEAAFMRCAEALRQEFGCKPSRATEEAYLQLRHESQRQLRKDSWSPRGEAQRLEVRFAGSPDRTVAYTTVGSGAETVVVISGFVSHIEIAWEHSGIRAALGRLAERFRMIMFDRRGMGLSERLDATGTVQSTASDVETILDAEGLERAWLFGSSEGGPAAIHLAASRPSRVAGLILFGAMAKGSYSEDYPWALRRDAFDRWMERLIGAWGGPSDIETFSPGECDDPSLRAWWARMLRHAASPASLRTVLAGLRDADVRTFLPAVRQPTLVLHRRGDRAVRFEAGEHLAAGIRDARFVALEGKSHWWWAEDADNVVNTISKFIDAAPSAARPSIK
jgi:DNA-binding SARP family transcriptional activator/pimeloyl-ACP methyl ester carboxylesterase